MNKNICVTIVTRESQTKQSRKEIDLKVERSPQPTPRTSTAQFAHHEIRKAQPKTKQLSLWESRQKPETEYSLKIEPLPPALQWWDEQRFWLVHSASGLRVPGSWTIDEAELILDLSRKWDWGVDKDRRVACGLQLLALAELVCRRSSSYKGGEA